VVIGASRLGPLGDALMVRTSGLAGVEIDARAHRARIKAGARWADLADPASFLGLAPAGGFDREASIVGTVLGDGMGWLARRHGLAAAGVTAVDHVTAEGVRERVEGDEAELLRALRGGGVITALELTLYPARAAAGARHLHDRPAVRLGAPAHGARASRRAAG
jgi:FAD/FMN-containing dehydrogenase